jgi:heptosyltransferase-2
VASFYAKNGVLEEAWQAYFGGFQQVISYLFDPDRIFEENLQRCGVKHYLPAFRKVTARHAAIEWAEPLQRLALFLTDPAARVFLKESDRVEGRAWVGEEVRPRLVVHPGSGSPGKNWPVAGWISVGKRFLARHPEGELIVVSGEADAVEVGALVSAFLPGQFREAHQLPLPLLGAVIADVGRFMGHDTGVAHLAAAVGCSGLLLFGPTSPELWAPKNSGIRVLCAPEGDWSRLNPGLVWQSAREHLGL